MATIKQMLAAGVTEIDLTTDAVQIVGRGGMAAYEHRAPSFASLTKLTKAENVALAARPLTFKAPHPAVAAYRDNVGAEKAKEEFRRFARVVLGRPYVRAIDSACIVDEALKQLAKQPNDIRLEAIVIWFGGEVWLKAEKAA